jgi:thiamine monophosphate synthase
MQGRATAMSAKLRQVREKGSEAKVAMADAAELHAEQVCVCSYAVLHLVHDRMTLCCMCNSELLHSSAVFKCCDANL